jgi:hypothetical protein
VREGSEGLPSGSFVSVTTNPRSVLSVFPLSVFPSFRFSVNG